MSFFQDLSLSGIQILTPLVLLFFSAFFSFAEAAIFAISSTELASKKNSAANILKKMVSDPEQLSMCLMVGYNLANISLASVSYTHLTLPTIYSE